MDWKLWQEFLRKGILSRGRQLNTPLGLWLKRDSDWTWYFSRKDSTLWSIRSDIWHQHKQVDSSSQALMFSELGILETPPDEDLEMAIII
jgi:hypothetical protein